jgi:tyrosine-protein phosphatase SIW14
MWSLGEPAEIWANQSMKAEWPYGLLSMQTSKIQLRNRTGGVSALVLALTLLGPAVYGQSQATYGELPNFYQVNEHLYRGAQPRSGGVKKLGDIGIKTIVNLRGEAADLSQAEEKEAKLAYIKYVNIPMAGIGRPTDEQMSQVMAVIDAPENWPVFIHCRRGSDRTGTVVACYRILHDRWDGAKATAEARKFGMSWIEAGMREYISDFYRSHPPSFVVQAPLSTQPQQ